MPASILYNAFGLICKNILAKKAGRLEALSWMGFVLKSKPYG
jgi:hypothetical protein